MIISIPRERKQGEGRVAITPDGTSLLSAKGHQVLIETQAGVKSGFGDELYQKAGARICSTLAETWEKADLLVKVKEPAPEEYQFFRKGLAVFSFLHPAAAPELVQAMIKHGVTGLDYDLLTVDGRLPILEPMSVVAGKLSIQCGAMALQSAGGGMGLCLAGFLELRRESCRGWCRNCWKQRSKGRSWDRSFCHHPRYPS